MKYFLITLSISFLMLIISCRKSAETLNIPEPVKTTYGKDHAPLTKEEEYDKVLGALVGSAIGDAMGASTEMWHRDDIRRKYGYIRGLTPAVRQQSPEGTWENNLGEGATTDDTRWKFLMVKYFSAHPDTLDSESFANFIIRYYEMVASDLGDQKILENPDLLNGKLEKVDWIREWARVALAYKEGPETYNRALSRFYGGEMACAGMLYTPMFGLKASSPENAYEMAYAHSLFDHGYAKDISSLVAAMTGMALYTSDMDSILDTAVFVDPQRYEDSRLVGRISLDIAQASRKCVWLAKEIILPDTLIIDGPGLEPVPEGYPENEETWARQEFVYAFLEKEQRAIPFHAGEIWQILITALEFGGGDFQKTMQFVVNYGRDNDTVAAIAGMILGARSGFSGLPESWRSQVLEINREQLGIDLEILADEMTGKPTTKKS